MRLDQQDSKIPISILTTPMTIIELPPNHMLIAYMKSIEICEIYHQCLMTKILNLIILI